MPSRDSLLPKQDSQRRIKQQSFFCVTPKKCAPNFELYSKSQSKQQCLFCVSSKSALNPDSKVGANERSVCVTSNPRCFPRQCGAVAKIVGYDRRCIPLDTASMVLKVKVRLKYSQNHIVWLFRRVSTLSSSLIH